MMSARVVLARLNGLSGLMKTELQSMTIRDPGDRQRAWKELFTTNTSRKVKQ
jgi:hypothetical protein